jgi:DNA polymerase-3 subunit delta
MAVTYTQFLAHPEQVAGVPWCLLRGREEHLKREVLARIVALLLPGDGAEFNLDQLDGDKATADNILMLAQTVPFLSDKRVIVVRSAQSLDADEQTKLAKSMERVGSHAFILLVTSESDNRRDTLNAGLTRALGKHGVVIDVGVFKVEEAVQWVRARARELGKEIEPAAAAELVRRTGAHLEQLGHEIEKLIFFVGDQARISPRDVQEVTASVPEEDIFRLVDAVGRKDVSRALMVLNHLLRVRNEQPLQILWFLTRQLRLIWQTKLLGENGWRPYAKDVPEKTAALLPATMNALDLFRSQAWLGARCAEQAARFSWEQLETAFVRFAACDLELKSAPGGARAERLLMELLITELCTGLRARVA